MGQPEEVFAPRKLECAVEVSGRPEILTATFIPDPGVFLGEFSGNLEISPVASSDALSQMMSS
jgi:hypothetical protein